MTQSEQKDGGNIGLEYVMGLYKDAKVETKDPQPIYIFQRDTIKAFLYEKAILLSINARIWGLLGVEVALITALLTAKFRDFSWIKGAHLQGFFIASSVVIAFYVAIDVYRMIKNWGACSVDILTEELGLRGSRIGQQSKDKKVERMMSDVSEHDELLENLRVMCWDGELWRLKQLEKTTFKKHKEYIEIKNTTGIHSFAIIILHIELIGNFRIQFRLQGEYENIRLNSSNGEDRCLYMNTSPEQLEKSNVHSVVITRQRNQVAFRTGEEVDLPMGVYRGNPDMACFVGITLLKDKSVKIFSCEVIES